MQIISLSTSFEQLRGQNTLVGIGLTELTEPSNTLNDNLLKQKHCILHIFLLFLFVCNNIFCCKN